MTSPEHTLLFGGQHHSYSCYQRHNCLSPHYNGRKILHESAFWTLVH